MAEFDGTTGAFISKYTGHTTSPVVSMAENGDGSIYTGHFNNRLQRFTPTGGQSWQVSFDGNVQALTVSDGEVIAGGHFQNLCDVGTNCANPIVRHHIAALDPASGALDTTWAPNVNSDLGVFALADTSVGLAVGGDFTNFGGTAQAHLAFLQTGAVAVDQSPPTIGTAPDAVLRKATTIASGQVPLLVRWARQRPERRLLLPAAAQRRRRIVPERLARLQDRNHEVRVAGGGHDAPLPRERHRLRRQRLELRARGRRLR